MTPIITKAGIQEMIDNLNKIEEMEYEQQCVRLNEIACKVCDALIIDINLALTKYTFEIKNNKIVIPLTELPEAAQDALEAVPIHIVTDYLDEKLKHYYVSINLENETTNERHCIVWLTPKN